MQHPVGGRASTAPEAVRAGIAIRAAVAEVCKACVHPEIKLGPDEVRNGHTKGTFGRNQTDSSPSTRGVVAKGVVLERIRPAAFTAPGIGLTPGIGVHHILDDVSIGAALDFCDTRLGNRTWGTRRDDCINDRTIAVHAMVVRRIAEPDAIAVGIGVVAVLNG